MSVLTPLLLRSLTGSARRLMVPRAQVHSKPAREQLGVLVPAPI
uniref:Cytochrome c oxidase subunit 8A n=1 Tax=Mus musculus TaxID=10090 RepID=A0A494B971_MOUSE